MTARDESHKPQEARRRLMAKLTTTHPALRNPLSSFLPYSPVPHPSFFLFPLR